MDYKSKTGVLKPQWGIAPLCLEDWRDLNHFQVQEGNYTYPVLESMLKIDLQSL